MFDTVLHSKQYHTIATGLTYCIQENLPFGSLRKHLKANRHNDKLNVSQELASYARNVISGVKFLHSHGVSIHCHFY